MRPRACARLAVTAGLALSGMVAAEEGTGPPVMIAAVRSDLDDAAGVGPKRTGIICGPAGHVVWREAKPDPLQTADAVVRTLREEGVRAFAYDRNVEEAATPYVAAAVITAARVSACVPQHGFVRLVGGRRSFKVNGSITVRWTIKPPGAAPLRGIETEQSLNRNGDAKEIADAVRDAVADSAKQLLPVFAMSTAESR